MKVDCELLDDGCMLMVIQIVYLVDVVLFINILVYWCVQ